MKLNFQTILLIVFGFFIAFGVAVFAGYINIGSSSKKATSPTGTVLFWGTINSQVMNQFIASGNVVSEGIKVTYVQKNPLSYENDLVSAFASGIGPDIFMVTPEIFWRQRDKMYETPYKSFPIVNYTSAYMDIGKTYLTSTGILAFPLFVDPLVGYWNKDIFASVSLAKAPVEWKEFPDLAKKISQVTNDYLISRSAVALGEYSNIRHARDIMTLLFLQAGDPIMHADPEGKLVVDFGLKTTANKTSSAAIALDFYAQFANPTKFGVYSWNKLFSSDIDEFLSGSLAYYFGLGSELSNIRRGNPNLNFDMAFVPQADKNGTKTTVGLLYGLAVSKQTKNLALSYYVRGDIISPAKNAAFIVGLQNAGLTVAPMRRDMVPDDPTNVYATTLYQSALVAKNWINPNIPLTDQIWSEMVSDLQSGKSNSLGAVSGASAKFATFAQTLQ